MKRIFQFILISVCCFTSCSSEEEKIDARVETLDATAITDAEAMAWGKITVEGTSGIREYGIEFNSQKMAHTATEAGSFGVRLSGLQQGQQYSYKAYAVENNGNICYGNEVRFTTLTPAEFWVTETGVTDRTADVEFGNTNYLSDWGLYYRAGSAATTADTKVEAKGAVTVTLTELEPATYYYILAYATDRNGIELTAIWSFMTQYAEPQLSVPVFSDITIAGATVTFEVVSTGGGETMPLCSLRYRVKGTENWTNKNVPYTPGDITCELTGLSPATEYEVQAFARNHGNKIAYSEIALFATEGAVPFLAKPAVAALTSYRVSMTDGKVTDNGLLAVTEYGFCWSATPGQAAVTAGNHARITAGSEDAFDYLSYDLLAGVQYYVRAYAKNAVGIGYSEEVEVKTPDIVYGTVDDWFIIDKKYKTVRIGNQTWMAEDLTDTDGSTTRFNVSKVISLGSDMCPTGWSLPTIEDWNELIDETGGSGGSGSNIAPKVLRSAEEGYYDLGRNSSGMSITANNLVNNSTVAVYWTSNQFISGAQRPGRRVVQFWSDNNTGDYVVVSSTVMDSSSDYLAYRVRCIKD